MFVGRKELFTLNYLMILIRLSSVISVRQTSALFKMVQPATASPQHGDRIRCANSATHHSYAGIRIAEGDGVCERLTDAEMALAKETDFEYFRKYSAAQQFQLNLTACMGIGGSITIYPYTELKVGDIFEFVLQRCGTDRFPINFVSNDGSIALHLLFTSSDVRINTLTTFWGGEQICLILGQFDFYKEYRICLEIFDAYWKICIDQNECCQYDHRLPVSTIREVTAPNGPLATLKSVKITTAVP